MGCVQTKSPSKKSPSYSLHEEKKMLYSCYQQGSKYVDECGKCYHVLREGAKLVKVPILKTLQTNPLYMRRTTSQSDFTGSPTKTI